MRIHLCTTGISPAVCICVHRVLSRLNYLHGGKVADMIEVLPLFTDFSLPVFPVGTNDIMDEQSPHSMKFLAVAFLEPEEEHVFFCP